MTNYEMSGWHMGFGSGHWLIGALILIGAVVVVGAAFKYLSERK